MTKPHEVWMAERRERWWAALSDDDRAFMRTCAEFDLCPPRAVHLLNMHGSPHGAIGTQWEGLDEYSWELSEPWRDFILTQARR